MGEKASVVRCEGPEAEVETHGDQVIGRFCSSPPTPNTSHPFFAQFVTVTGVPMGALLKKFCAMKAGIRMHP